MPTDTNLENLRHAVTVLELEKKQYKLKAKALALRLAHVEKLYADLRKGA